jgi:protein-S-isoprenylcysteine O-methyltransferase Ste14
MTEPLIFRFLLALDLLVFVAHRAYYTRKFPAPEDETVRKLESTAASRLAAVLSVVALIASLIYVVYPPLIAWAALPFPIWLRWLGVGIAAAGFLLLEWSHRALGRNWSDQPRITRSQRLVEIGPYRRIRHPIYAAFLLILGSTLLISANWLVGLCWIVSVAIESGVRMGYEERAMREQFGDAYREYERRTGRLIPRP